MYKPVKGRRKGEEVARTQDVTKLYKVRKQVNKRKGSVCVKGYLYRCFKGRCNRGEVTGAALSSPRALAAAGRREEVRR